MLCGLNQNHYRAFEDKVDQTTKSVKDHLKAFWNNLKEFFNDEHEYYGVVEKIDPIFFPITTPSDLEAQPSENQIPEGSCYHLLTMKDGKQFRLIFPHVQFETLEPRLQPGYAIKVTYTNPSSNTHPMNNENDHAQPLPNVVNIYPRPYYKVTPYDLFIEEDLPNFQDDTLVRVHYLEDQITRLDFLQNLDEDKPKSD